MNEHITGSLLFVGLVGTQGVALGYRGLPRWGGRFGMDVFGVDVVGVDDVGVDDVGVVVCGGAL